MMSYLETQRALTLKYIEYDPTTIALIPYVDTPSATGGFIRTEGEPRSPQTFKRIAQGGNPRPTVTIAGVERIVDYVLLGVWDCEIEIGDHWTDDKGTIYEIILIQAGHGYEKKAFVERRFPKDAS
jgi:hypothetical protein